MKPHTLSNPQTIVRRKPVLRGPNFASSDEPTISSSVHVPLQARSPGPYGGAKLARKPLDQSFRAGYEKLEAPPALPPRKLVGPRSMIQRLRSADSSALQNAPERQNIDMRRWSEQPGALPPRLPPRMDSIRGKQIEDVPLKGAGNSMEVRRTPIANESLAEHCWDWERSWEQKRATEAREEMDKLSSEWQDSRENSMVFEDTSLSLIRRYNGEQWNIGKILGIGTNFGVPSTADAATSFEIMTEGYRKFVDPQDLNGHSSPSSTTENVFSTGAESNNVFRRRFQIPENLKRPSPNHTLTSSGSRSFAKEDRSSSEHRQPNHENSSYPTADLSGHKTSSLKGYVLRSPWNGLCEFTTGIAGRSLKCKHSYALATPTLGSGMFSAPVSELRFNLPSSKVLGKPAAKSSAPRTPKDGKRSSQLLGSHHHRKSSSYGTHESGDPEYFGPKIELGDRLDLSLGQEHAGGGFGGKHAKLGKLIIEVEGLQMLDFLVAANMALWWRIYERIT